MEPCGISRPTSVGALIIPQELPTILSVVYSNIPPILKGTDSRLGLGFRLGPHADFQVLLELGPQISTQQLGPSPQESKRRRQTAKSRPTLIPIPDETEDTPGGKWLSSWRSGLFNPSQNTVPAAIKKQPLTHDPTQNDSEVVSHLRQLYVHNETNPST